LLNRSQQLHQSRGDDGQRITRAREAAEALFTPRRQVTEPSVPETLPPADQSARRPRVLAGQLPAEMTPEIPASQVARIRALVKYRMTARQVAEVYGVAVGEIERILRKN
jgi:hypothetical protein